MSFKTNILRFAAIAIVALGLTACAGNDEVQTEVQSITQAYEEAQQSVERGNYRRGILIFEGANLMLSNTWLLLFPSLFFSATLFALNFLGDGLRDALDPKASKD